MGLAVVHGIVEKYNGKIFVKSTLGQGSVFTVYMPVTRKSYAYKFKETEELPSGTERILLVDDEAPIAAIGQRILESLGYSVITRTSSVKALELFHSNPADVDLVITDMAMPNMAGDRLASALMAIRPDIPVILCTGHSKKLSEESALAMGIKALLYKPVTKTDIAKTVRRVLDETKI